MGLFVGPIISGNIAARVSWRWFFWACTIAQFLNVIAMAALFPESRRPHEMQILQIAPAQSSEGLTEEEKGPSIQIEATNETIMADKYLGRGKPNRSQFNPFQPIDHQAAKAIFRHILTPVQIFFFPIVLWAAMSMGAAANALLAVNLTQSQGLSAPPYNWSPGSVGFANFALVGGGVIGLAIAGPWSDLVIMLATKKNNGIREPEMRLAALYPFIAAALVGLVVSLLKSTYNLYTTYCIRLLELDTIDTGPGKLLWCWVLVSLACKLSASRRLQLLMQLIAINLSLARSWLYRPSVRILLG